jgi:hypothetical protein
LTVNSYSTDGGVANSANGKTEAADPNATSVNRRTWRELTITAGDWDVQTLEPLSWIKSNHVKDGSQELLSDFVNVAEMGVPAGLAGTVDSISACPAIQSGPGRVVLATVSHLNADVYHLTLKNEAGKTETLGVTGYHRFYDVNAGWVDVQSMYNGETVRGDHGDLTVVGLVRDPGTDRVYNMTVEADHVYYVGDLGALVHNSCGYEEHHIATDKSSSWTPLFEELFDEAGVEFNDPENLVDVLGHSGPHSDEYHSYIYSELLDATDGLEGDDLTDALTERLLKLGEECATPGSFLNDLITNGN